MTIYLKQSDSAAERERGGKKVMITLLLRKAKTIFKEICDVLRDLVPFGQFKKREKHPWRTVTFSEIAGF